MGRGPIRVTALRNPADLPWGDVDIVMECTGIFTSKEKCLPHLENGSKRVLISAPGEGADKTIVYGVNHDTLTGDDIVVSNASCTTNCLSPVAHVLHKAIGIEKGMMTTVHSYTGDQPTLDTMHKDLYRARAAALSMIPTSTGAAKAVGLVLPELNGKLDGFAMRVPTPNVSVVDLKFIAKRATSRDEINAAIKAAADGTLKGILGYTTDKNVSVDFNRPGTPSATNVSTVEGANVTGSVDSTVVKKSNVSVNRTSAHERPNPRTPVIIAPPSQNPYRTGSALPPQHAASGSSPTCRQRQPTPT